MLRIVGMEPELREDPLGGSVDQGIDPRGWASSDSTGGQDRAEAATGVLEALGDRPVVEVRRDWPRIVVDDRSVDVFGIRTDLTSDLGADLVELTDGRLPRAGDEVAVTSALARDGAEVGDTITLGEDRLEVVGEFADRQYAGAGILRTLGEPTSENAWEFADVGYVVGGAAIEWDEVERLNEAGAAVYSRAVVSDPSPEALQAEAEWSYSGDVSSEEASVLALIVVMVLLEVVLLAGPAFAVGARRQSRALALMASTGGTPAQVRGVIIGGGFVLGLIAAVVGIGGGLFAAAVGWPIIEWVTSFDAFSDWAASTRPGPFDVPWAMLAAVGAFGLVSALLAAAVPAWLASRSDVVAVLAGRRGDPPPRRRSPIAGAILLAAGVVMAAYGSKLGDTVVVTGAAVVAVLGMVLLVGPLLALIARLAGRFPLALRYAVRDAARQRTRAVPAAAVLPTSLARSLDLQVEPVGLLLPGDVSSEVESDIDEALAQLQTGDVWPSIYVERGWGAETTLRYILLGLGVAALALVLGGSLTATRLAMNDARPDLATLGAVGAAPGVQRRVAGAYALVLTAVGSLFGAAVGFVPGIAAAYPLTNRGYYEEGMPPPEPVIDVPWLLVVMLVVLVPLVVAGIAWATTRVRLPLVRRLT